RRSLSKFHSVNTGSYSPCCFASPYTPSIQDQHQFQNGYILYSDNQLVEAKWKFYSISNSHNFYRRFKVTYN
ncbi:hypothetical protein CEXT_479701, partial [Caerostris extrusa]